MQKTNNIFHRWHTEWLWPNFVVCSFRCRRLVDRGLHSWLLLISVAPCARHITPGGKRHAHTHTGCSDNDATSVDLHTYRRRPQWLMSCNVIAQITGIRLVVKVDHWTRAQGLNQIIRINRCLYLLMPAKINKDFTLIVSTDAIQMIAQCLCKYGRFICMSTRMLNSPVVPEKDLKRRAHQFTL